MLLMDEDDTQSLPRNNADDQAEIVDGADDQGNASAPPTDADDTTINNEFDRFVTVRRTQNDRPSSAPLDDRLFAPSHFETRRSRPPTCEPSRSVSVAGSYVDDPNNTRLKQREESLGEALDEISQRFRDSVRIRDVRDKETQSATPTTTDIANKLSPNTYDIMDASFSPKPFRGQVGEDVETFLQEFVKYVEYRELNDNKALALLKLLLKDGAGEWLSRLDVFTRQSLRGVKAALLERYGRSKIIKHKTARELFARKQGIEEDVETFISACIKLSTSFGTEAETMAMYAIMGGLKPQLATFVAQKQPDSLKQLIEQARLAELTVSQASLDQPMIQQLSEMKAEIQRLGSKLEKATTSQIRSSSPSDARRVRFDDKPRRRQSPTNYRSQDNRADRRDRQQRQWNSQQGPPAADNYQQKQDCTRCGFRGGHDHPNRCRAINLTCRYCGKMGHFAAKCRKAARDHQAKDQSPQ